jgi:hypothetical protein
MKKPTLAQKLHRILRPVVRESAYQHDPFLINRLAAFNFRRRLMLEFPGDPLARVNGFWQ